MRRLPILLLFLVNAAAALAEDIVTLPTRGSVTQSYLLSAPESGTPQAVAVLFPGGDGKTDLERETARNSARTRQFSRALTPSSSLRTGSSPRSWTRRPIGPAGWTTTSGWANAHAEDIGKVADDLKKRFPGVPLFLVGTSRGTISAAVRGQAPRQERGRRRADGDAVSCRRPRGRG